MGIIINLDEEKGADRAFKRGGYHDGKLIYFKK